MSLASYAPPSSRATNDWSTSSIDRSSRSIDTTAAAVAGFEGEAMTDAEIEREAEEVMQEIHRHRCCDSSMPRSVSILFLETIAQSCRDWADTIKSEDEADE
jgi:hypothetical protein